jgi:hypothetical protein
VEDQEPSTLQDLQNLLVHADSSNEIIVGYLRAVDVDPALNTITVNLKVDTTVIQPGFIPLSAANYTFNPIITFTKDQLVLPVKITLKKANLSFTNNYSLAISIDSLANKKVSVNPDANGLNFSISQINRWDGVYSLRGYTFKSDDSSKTGLFSVDEIELATDEESMVSFRSFQPWSDGEDIIGIGMPVLTIDKQTNKVEINSSGGAYTAPGYNSRYDPVTRTFYISFTWGNGPTERLATDTLTFLRNR